MSPVLRGAGIVGVGAAIATSIGTWSSRAIYGGSHGEIGSESATRTGPVRATSTSTSDVDPLIPSFGARLGLASSSCAWVSATENGNGRDPEGVIRHLPLSPERRLACRTMRHGEVGNFRDACPKVGHRNIRFRATSRGERDGTAWDDGGWVRGSHPRACATNPEAYRGGRRPRVCGKSPSATPKSKSGHQRFEEGGKDGDCRAGDRGFRVVQSGHAAGGASAATFGVVHVRGGL